MKHIQTALSDEDARQIKQQALSKGVTLSTHLANLIQSSINAPLQGIPPRDPFPDGSGMPPWLPSEVQNWIRREIARNEQSPREQITKMLECWIDDLESPQKVFKGICPKCLSVIEPGQEQEGGGAVGV